MEIEQRVIIEDADGNLYYPPVVSCGTERSYPFQVPTARIIVAMGGRSSDFYTRVTADNIVRHQVKINNDNWKDVFEGRIMEVRQPFSASRMNRTLFCRGHAEELIMRMPTADYNGSTVTTGDVLTSLFGSYLTRLSIGTIDTSNSTEMADYVVEKHTKYLSDVLVEMQQVEANGYCLRTNTSYNSDGTLSAVTLDWEPRKIMDTPRAISGTKRASSAEFVHDISGLVNTITVYGDAVSSTATDSASVTRYGTRELSFSDMSATTENQCSTIAAALLTNSKNPITKGIVSMNGSAKLDEGDLMYCKFPEIHLDGAVINGNYQIKRVTDRINSSGWEQNVEVGRRYSNTSELLTILDKRLRLTNAGLI